SDNFVGLPIPAGAAMNASIVLLFNKLNFDVNGYHVSILIMVMLYILSFLMVSSVSYNSFKKPELFRKMNFNVLVAVILILIFIASQPSIALFSLGLAYVISGPVTKVRFLKKSENKKPKPAI
ncbi:MAG: CDP-diacylglycerol--serine O-phosphatidyltransferase, partial [Deltaproteobacteria bacterium]|nr:CDP-diacylglycerol--serine O-phosphatidyltransferase [Deltaproteobacteria bacterium]